MGHHKEECEGRQAEEGGRGASLPSRHTTFPIALAGQQTDEADRSWQKLFVSEGYYCEKIKFNVLSGCSCG